MQECWLTWALQFSLCNSEWRGSAVFSSHINILYSVVCRLYWFPTKVIYSAMHISVRVYPDGPYYLLFNPMLWGLFAMQVIE